MSIIDDYAAIGKALHELTEPPKVERPVAEPQPSEAQQCQAHYQQTSRQYLKHGCWLCWDVGWISVFRGGLWTGLPCPHCGNPSRRGCPTI